MSDRSTHIVAGALAGALIALWHPQLADHTLSDRIIMGCSLGAIGGVLPDLLEPPDFPSHRGFAHSYAFLGGSLHGSIRAANPVVALLSAGYASHLILDASTPANLPLLSRGA